MTPQPPAVPDALIEKLAAAREVVAFTGAGVSAESGVPTFRGPDGIWAKFKPEELASMEAFMKNPALVWEWYAHRRTIISAVQPNPGHVALAALENVIPRVTVVTQNIDNLHRRAGSKRLFELHGNIERSYCMKCGKAYPDIGVVEKGSIPRCNCGGTIRPDVVWFGEMLPEGAWEASVAATTNADMFFSIGTSAVVYPAASLPFLAKRNGALVVEINPDPTPLTESADWYLQGPSGVLLPEIYRRILELKRKA
ncbi:MAG TPA: NAD-dependent deacylase [Bacteroidota bacterium]|nr:NAD-dependent deacylase [Bacteroidota bacterium]